MPQLHANAHMGSKDLQKYCPLPAEGEELLTTAINRLGLSARAYDRIIKVARTIADLAGEEDIATSHLERSSIAVWTGSCGWGEKGLHFGARGWV